MPQHTRQKNAYKNKYHNSSSGQSVYYNPANERIKRQYYQYVTEAQGKAPSTLNGIRKAINRFEYYTKFKDFKTFTKDQAISFKKHVSQLKAQRSGALISKSTLLATLNAVKDFLKWLAYQPGYKSKIYAPDIAYLNLSTKEKSMAHASEYKPHPSLAQINHVIANMPTETEVQRRNRAIIAFLVLTGIRDGAIISLKLKHIHLDRNLVVQDPKEVSTKFSKRINTFFFPVDDSMRQIVVEWVDELRTKKLYDNSAPLFPRTKLTHDENNAFAANGLEPAHWESATQVRKIVKEAFEAVGLSYYNPHSFRNTLVELGQQICTTPEQFKAWSQNLGHESPLTTFTSYGTVSMETQGKIMMGLNKSSE